jgi:hypothetical protein
VRLPLLFSFGYRAGRLSLPDFVALTATRHAQIYGCYPQKGTIAVGSDADIVVYDPNGHTSIGLEKTHHMNMDYSAYEGRRVRGLPEVVLQRGQVLVQDGTFHGKPGQGRGQRQLAAHGDPDSVRAFCVHAAKRSPGPSLVRVTSVRQRLRPPFDHLIVTRGPVLMTPSCLRRSSATSHCADG